MKRISQREFDKAVKGIRQQGGPSIRKEGFGCAYRGKDGRRCAVGWLLSDKRYRKDMEGRSANYALPEYDVAQINDFQMMHDDTQDDATYHGVDFMEAFENNARRFAERNGLKYSPALS